MDSYPKLKKHQERKMYLDHKHQRIKMSKESLKIKSKTLSATTKFSTMKQ